MVRWSRPEGGAPGVSFNPTPPLDDRDERRVTTSPEDDLYSAAPPGYEDIDSPPSKNKKSKSKLSMLSLLTLKEPSQAALKEFAADQRRAQGPRTGSSVSGSVSNRKLPDHVPKVNSKWDGMPASYNRLKSQSLRPSISRAATASAPPRTSTGTSNSSSSQPTSAELLQRSINEDIDVPVPTMPPRGPSGPASLDSAATPSPPLRDDITAVLTAEKVSPNIPDKVVKPAHIRKSASVGALPSNVLTGPIEAVKSAPSSPRQNQGTFYADDNEDYIDFGTLDGTNELDKVLANSIPISTPRRDIFDNVKRPKSASPPSRAPPSKHLVGSRSMGTISAIPKINSQSSQSSRVAMPPGIKLRRRDDTQQSKQQWPLPPSSKLGQTFGSPDKEHVETFINSGSHLRSNFDEERPYRPRPWSRSGLVSPTASPPRHPQPIPSRSPSSLISSANAPRGQHIPRGIPPSVLPGRVVTRDTDLDTIPESDTASILSKAPSLNGEESTNPAYDSRELERIAAVQNGEPGLKCAKEGPEWAEPFNGATSYSFRIPSDTSDQHLANGNLDMLRPSAPLSALSLSGRSSSEFSIDVNQSSRERLGLGSNISYKQQHEPWLAFDNESDLDSGYDRYGNPMTSTMRNNSTTRLIRAFMR